MFLDICSCDGVFIDSLKKYCEVSSSVDAAASGQGAINERAVTQLRGIFDESAKEIDKYENNGTILSFRL